MFESQKLIYIIPFINFSTLFYGMFLIKEWPVWASIYFVFFMWYRGFVRALMVLHGHTHLFLCRNEIHC